MKLLSNAINGTVLFYLCSLHECDAIRIGKRAAGHMPAITTSWRDGGVPDSSLAVSGDSARNNTFGEKTDSSGEDIITSPGSQSDTTVNAQTLDNGCTDGNGTYLCMGTPSGPDFPQENHIVITVINRVQLVVTCAGFLANGATYLTLSCNGERFSMLILLVIKHQALVDMGICGMGALYLLLPATNWLTGNRIADFIVCHAWHSQGMFWGNVFVSTWNLVLIDVERYIMICKPFIYNTVTKRQLFYAFAGTYVGSFVFVIPVYIAVHFVNGECLWQSIMGNFGHNFYYGYSIFVFFIFYFFPVGAFVFIYG